MSLERFLVHTVTLTEPAVTVNRYGETVPDWSATPVATYEERAWITRTSTDEMAEGREAITDQWEISLPVRSAITAAMRVEHRGVTYEVRGSVQQVDTPGGGHHLVAQLRKVQG